MNTENKPTPLSMVITHVFTGQTQYYGGHHLPDFVITVDGLTTYRTLKTEMQDWQTTDHLNEEVFYFPHSGEMFDAAVEQLFSTVEDMDAIMFPDLDKPPELTDDDEQPEGIQEWYDNWEGVAWFTIKLDMPEEDDEEQLSISGTCTTLE